MMLLKDSNVKQGDLIEYRMIGSVCQKFIVLKVKIIRRVQAEAVSYIVYTLLRLNDFKVFNVEGMRRCDVLLRLNETNHKGSS